MLNEKMPTGLRMSPPTCSRISFAINMNQRPLPIVAIYIGDSPLCGGLLREELHAVFFLDFAEVGTFSLTDLFMKLVRIQDLLLQKYKPYDTYYKVADITISMTAEIDTASSTPAIVQGLRRP